MRQKSGPPTSTTEKTIKDILDDFSRYIVA